MDARQQDVSGATSGAMARLPPTASIRAAPLGAVAGPCRAMPSSTWHGADPNLQAAVFMPAPLPCGSWLSGQQVRERRMSKTSLVTFLGLLTYVFACMLPVLSACALLGDENYRFWRGTTYPAAALTIVLVTGLFLGAVVFLLTREGMRGSLDRFVVALTASSFAALLGLLLVIAVVPASHELHNIARTLHLGCDDPLAEASILADYSQVLSNLRFNATCAAAESVESCQGWHENNYTAYLRHLEAEFQCGPFCATAASLASSAPAPPVKLLRLQGRPHLDLFAGATADKGETNDLAMELEPDDGMMPKLFGRGRNRMHCTPLVSTRLQVLAWYHLDVIFWEGILLLCGSIVSSSMLVLSSHFESQSMPSKFT